MALGLPLAVDTIQPMITIYSEFRALKAVPTKSTMFWDVTPCSLIEFHRSFRGRYYLQIHCRRIKQATSNEQAASGPSRQHRQTKAQTAFQPTVRLGFQSRQGS
jgi:hypothetical protein